MTKMKARALFVALALVGCLPIGFAMAGSTGAEPVEPATSIEEAVAEVGWVSPGGWCPGDGRMLPRGGYLRGDGSGCAEEPVDEFTRAPSVVTAAARSTGAGGLHPLCRRRFSLPDPYPAAGSGCGSWGEAGDCVRIRTSVELTAADRAWLSSRSTADDRDLFDWWAEVRDTPTTSSGGSHPSSLDRMPDGSTATSTVVDRLRPAPPGGRPWSRQGTVGGHITDIWGAFVYHYGTAPTVGQLVGAAAHGITRLGASGRPAWRADPAMRDGAACDRYAKDPPVFPSSRPNWGCAFWLVAIDRQAKLGLPPAATAQEVVDHFRGEGCPEGSPPPSKPAKPSPPTPPPPVEGDAVLRCCVAPLSGDALADGWGPEMSTGLLPSRLTVLVGEACGDEGRPGPVPPPPCRAAELRAHADRCANALRSHQEDPTGMPWWRLRAQCTAYEAVGR